MKKIVAVMGLVAVMSAVALGADWGGQYPYPVRSGAGQKPSWRALTADMPGVIGLLNRLDLTQDQENVLDEIWGEWLAKRNRASAEAWKKMPKALTAEEYKDAEKRKQYQEKYQAVMKEAVVPPPTEQVMAVLTPDQVQKMGEANSVTAAWGKTVAEILAKYNKVLDEVVGPAVAVEPGSGPTLNVLGNYKKGTPGLANRLAFTKEQMAALREASTGMYAPSARASLAFGAVTESKLSAADSALVREALTEWASVERSSRLRDKVAAILTEDQRARIDKGLLVVEERNKAINASYDEYAAKIEKILPEPKKKAATPVDR